MIQKTINVQKSLAVSLLIFAIATVTQDAPVYSASPSQKACFMRDANPRNKTGKAPELPATSEYATALLSNGYKETVCTLSSEKISEFRDQICRLATLNNMTVNARFDATYAISPATMCAALNAHMLAD